MDNNKIGRFIAYERKNKQYTQRQLADVLEISNKTVSKWECGNGFPEVSLLLPLCNELGITVNELLSAERLQDEEYKAKAEENILNMISESKKTKEEKIVSVALTIAIMVTGLASAIIARYFVTPEAQAVNGIISIISLSCFVIIWIVVTVVLRKK